VPFEADPNYARIPPSDKGPARVKPEKRRIRQDFPPPTILDSANPENPVGPAYFISLEAL
jgi:hypothetical protein